MDSESSVVYSDSSSSVVTFDVAMSTGSLGLILEYELLFRHLRHLECDSGFAGADNSDGLLPTVGLTCGLLYD